MLLNTVDLLKYSIFLRLSFVMLLIFSCKKQEKATLAVNTGYALGTSYLIKYENTNNIVNLQKSVEEVINDVNQSMSTYISTSDISKINQGDTTITVDAYFKEVFLKSKEIWEKTSGDFDPTVGSLVNAWGFGPEDQLNSISKEQIDSILMYVGFDKLTLTESNKINKLHPEIYIDFNALAKGYTIDLIGRLLDEKGLSNYLIELGGEILTRGYNPETGNDWIVAIDDPTQEDLAEKRSFAATLKLNNSAMATSGNYRKFRIDTANGERYVHTINPKTGYTKKSKILSASVLAKTCMEADAYATAFMVMDLEKTKKLLSTLDSIDAYIIIAGEGNKTEVFATDGFKTLTIE